MKIRKMRVAIFLVVMCIFTLRENGIISFNLYKSNSQADRSNGMFDLDSFKNVGTVEIVDHYGNSKKYTVSDSKHEIRLTVKDTVESYTFMRWVPFVKIGESTVRCYLSVENQHDNKGWSKWAKVIPVQITINLNAYGFLSAYEYKKIILKSMLDFNDSKFLFLKGS